MALSDDFKSYCEDLLLSNLDTMKTTSGEIAKKLNNYYYGLQGEINENMYIVGSVGRNTAIDHSSDLDLLFDLPNSVYKKFDAYTSNGQSALLQEVKGVLAERYPKTTMRGDGQVVVIEFANYTVELVPGFKQSDDRFKYPDTHDGGSWKYTDPLSEQAECQVCNANSNGIYYDFCHLIRKWKNNIGFEFGGLLVDTLVYNHFESTENYSNSSYSNYLTILQNLFEYLKGLNKAQTYWYAVGSNQQVNNSDDGIFVDKAGAAFDLIKKAIEDKTDINTTLQDLFGSDFPSSAVAKASATYSNLRYTNTEQFIEKQFPLDIRYSVQLDCKVSQNGWRDFYLSDLLRGRGILKHNKQLDFYIVENTVPNPYDIYWKVRNIGIVAEQKNCIRGQINQTNSEHHKERTSFQGPHYVECYIIKNGICVARGRIDVPIGTC